MVLRRAILHYPQSRSSEALGELPLMPARPIICAIVTNLRPQLYYNKRSQHVSGIEEEKVPVCVGQKVCAIIRIIFCASF